MTNPMKQLAVIGLSDLQRVRIGSSEYLTPEYLVAHRGICIALLLSGRPFVDTELGYAIVRSEFLQDPIKLRGFGFDDNLSAIPFSTNWHAEIRRAPSSPSVAPNLAADPWYLDSRKWPRQKGTGIRVAVFDSGITPALDHLRRIGDDSDFCSCVGERAPTEDLDYHGTHCAGAISALNNNGSQTSPAPKCDLIAVRIQRADNHNQITLVDMLLMLSWSFHCWQARVINMSFTLKRDQTDDKENVEMLSRVVSKLRRDNRALVFSAGVEEPSEVNGLYTLGYPACLDGFVAVGTYERHNHQIRTLQISADAWRAKADLLFGPGGTVRTVGTDGKFTTFNSASAACAFVSGIAALYVEAYWSQTPAQGRLDMQGILDLMKSRGRAESSTAMTSVDNWAIANLHPGIL